MERIHVASIEPKTYTLNEIRQIHDWQMRQKECYRQRKTLLVLALGFCGPEDERLSHAVDLLSPMHRTYDTHHQLANAMVVMDGFDLETGTEGFEIGLEQALQTYSPAAVLFLCGPRCWADDQVARANAGYMSKDRHGQPWFRKRELVSPMMGECIHRGYTVFYHSVKPEGMRAYDPEPADRKRKDKQPLEITETLCCKQTVVKLGNLQCRRFEEVKFPVKPRDDEGRIDKQQVRKQRRKDASILYLEDTPARFGKCSFWSMKQLKEYGMLKKYPGRDFDAEFETSLDGSVSIDLCPRADNWEMQILKQSNPARYRELLPHTFSQATDDYWRHLLGQGCLYGVYRQRVRQYVNRVIGPTPEGKTRGRCSYLKKHRMEVMSHQEAAGGPGCVHHTATTWHRTDKTVAGFWNLRDEYVATGAMESVPRHWVDFSAYLEGKRKPEIEEGQHLSVKVKPWLDTEDDNTDFDAEDEEDQFQPSTLAWQDEYDKIGSWAADAHQEEKQRFHARMVWPTIDSRAERLKATTVRCLDPLVAERDTHGGGWGTYARIAPDARWRKERTPNVVAAWIEDILDRTDTVRGLIDQVVTCRQEVTDPTTEDAAEKQGLDQLRAKLSLLQKMDSEQREYLKEQYPSLWEDFRNTSLEAKEAVVRRLQELSDPDSCLKQSLKEQALEAMPLLQLWSQEDILQQLREYQRQRKLERRKYRKVLERRRLRELSLKRQRLIRKMQAAGF